MLTFLVFFVVLGVLSFGLFLYRNRADTSREVVELPSREYFDRYLRSCVARAARRPRHLFGVLVLDLRGFEQFRRSLGRSARERVLADFVERVVWMIRPTDVLSRLDETRFAIILDDVRRSADFTRVAARIRQSMAEAVALENRDAKVDVPIGATMNRPGSLVEAPALIAEAEEALQRAVSSGRPYVVFDEQLDATSSSELTLEAELSVAVEDSQFSLVFQPMVLSDSRRLIGFTAFVQWLHPTRGSLRASDWIGVAESSRQMVKIGEWVVANAVRATKQLMEAAERPLILTFNVGASEVERGDFAQHIAEALAEDPSLASSLRIELPSSVFVEPTPALAGVASKLRELGVGIHIDHAAMGSVALWRSLQLGVRGVRINLSEIDATDAFALGQLLAANRQIAEEVVVEGIESLEDDRVVRHLSPPVIAQGYQIARPMPIERALDLARTSADDPAREPTAARRD
jgi:diguanylate cyclase (GGDEF)-like protein